MYGSTVNLSVNTVVPVPYHENFKFSAISQKLENFVPVLPLYLREYLKRKLLFVKDSQMGCLIWVVICTGCQNWDVVAQWLSPLAATGIFET
jgi:hypothetical protein